MEQGLERFRLTGMAVAKISLLDAEKIEEVNFETLRAEQIIPY